MACGVIATAALTAQAQTYYWSAFAGLPPQVGSVDAVGADARFTNPMGLVSTVGRTIYVCDSGNHTIRRIAPDGSVVTLAGSPGENGAVDGGATAARFWGPRGITLVNGLLYVADTGNHAIRQVGGNGVTSTFAGRLGISGTVDGTGTNARFNRPGAIDRDTAGNLYVADTGNHAIRKITPEGEVTTVAGVPGSPGASDGPATSARFNGPAGLYVTSSGVVYVTDTQNHTIRRIGTDGMVTTIAGTAGVQGTTNGVGAAARFRFPTGVVVYTDGTLLVCDQAHAIRLITPAGSVSTYAGRSGVEGARNGALTDARFYVPQSMCFHPDGVAIADSFNHAIRLLSVPRRDVITLAGSSGNFGRVDGMGAEALFNFPNGVAVHPSGDLYLADSRGNSIRRILPDGQVLRVAGAEGDAYIDGPASVQSLNYPYGLAVTADRTVYFCEQQRHTIRVLRPDGSVATVAGQEGTPGAANGTGGAAQFNFPSGIALDAQGNLYIADRYNHLIRRIAAGTNTVTTFAGVSGSSGAEDGTTGARFNFPRDLVVDRQGNVYVADGNNSTIRKITPQREVSTLAGVAGTSGSANGAGSVARFSIPICLAIDAEGTLYVGDSGNDTIRKIVGNTVSTIGGVSQGTGFRDGAGTNAVLNNPSGIAVGAGGTLYVSEAGSNIVRRGDIMVRPAISAEPASQAVRVGGTATLSVAATGGGLRYQWQRNGVLISGATHASYTITNASGGTNDGEYRVTVTNSLGSIASANATLTVAPAANPGRLINLSILSALSSPGDAFTLGFVVGGAGTTGSKPLLIRAAGPSLGALGVPDTLADPQLELFSGSRKTGENDNWRGRADLAAAMRNVGAFAYVGIDSLDAAAAGYFDRGNNSVNVSAVGSGTGSVIAEIYDGTAASAFTTATPRLINVSVLKHIGSGLVAGFAIGGGESKKVLIRAVGPTLGADPFGVDGVVPDPQLTLFAGQTPIGSNDNWRGTAELAAAATQVGAFPLPADSRDAALVATLAPGTYTVEVTGVGGTTGLALVEVYEVP